MKRVYTSHEMRDMVSDLENNLQYGMERVVIPSKSLIAMLLQAADMLDGKKRKRRYEYSEKKKDGEIDIQHQESLKEARSLKFFKDSTIVRREVGEWENVNDAQ